MSKAQTHQVNVTKNDDWETPKKIFEKAYSQITQWIKKAYEQHRKYNVDALILVFSKISTKWWHDYVEDKGEIHFQKGRIRFLVSV